MVCSLLFISPPHYSRTLFVGPQPGFGSRCPGIQVFPLSSHACTSAGLEPSLGKVGTFSHWICTLLIITVFSCFSSCKSFLLLFCSHSVQKQAELSWLQEATHTCRPSPAIWPLPLQVWSESLGSLFKCIFPDLTFMNFDT